MNKSREGEAWYRNPWVWLVIAIPSLTVAGCMFTIYLALSHPDYLVREPSVGGATVDAPAQASP